MIDLAALSRSFEKKESQIRRDIAHTVNGIEQYLTHPSPKTAEALTVWKEEFAYLYGDAGTGLPDDGDGSAQLHVCAVQTCFGLLIKLLTWNVLQMARGVRQQGCMPGIRDREWYAKLLTGSFAPDFHVENYCDNEWHCWPVYELDRGFAGVIDGMGEMLQPYCREMSPEELTGGENEDHIRRIYEAMIPRKLRHALGEYYTPDWLAERTLRESLRYAGGETARLRIVDPTCGSGTFLMQAIREKRRAGCGLEELLDTVLGFDINALAVLTAKTNYLLAIPDLLGTAERVALPIRQMDALRTQGWEPFLHSADLVVGNPPWVNWEHLPGQYRMQSRHLWTEYGLFCARGRERSFAKEDISVLVTYVVMDRLLRRGGVLGFVLRQAAFKSAHNGAGFRRFRLPGGEEIGVLRVDDLSGIRAFEGAVVGTALFYARKGEPTVYPAPYYVWEKRPDIPRASLGDHSRLTEVLAQVRIREECAMPAAPGDDASPWLNAPRERLESMRRALGSNPYRARTGVFTGGANGVYWLRVKEASRGLVRVENVTERAKRKVESGEAWLEGEYLFPMIRGSNVRRWNVDYDTYILCPHTAQSRQFPVPGETLQETCPHTYAYLQSFRGELDERKGFAGWEKEIQRQQFHAVLRVGEYTFRRYKTLWKYIAREFICAVAEEAEDPYLGRKVCLPNEKVMYVGTDNETEAYYLCGILSSSLIADCVKGYMNPTCISAHVLDKLNIPEFDGADERHLEIARLCRLGHKERKIRPYLDQIDAIVRRMFS